MKEFIFPPCRQQKDFEDLARELIKIMAAATVEQQLEIFEEAQRILFLEPKQGGYKK